MSERIDSDDFIVTARDVADAGFCITPGLKEFLAIRGYDLKDFIRHGLPAKTMLGFNDAQSDRVVAKARERVSRG
mgnify:FL=1